MNRTLLALIAAALVAGCTEPSETTSGAVGDLPVANIVLRSMSVTPSGIELGDAVRVIVGLDNLGRVAGAGTVHITVDGATMASIPVELAAGQTRDFEAEIVPPRPGQLQVKATFGSTERLSVVVVRGPALGDGTWDYEDRWCDDTVPFMFSVRNNGDGLARDVVARVSIFNDNNALQDAQDVSLGTLAAGNAATGSAELFAPDACGRDDYVHVRVEAQPRFGDAYAFETEPFSI